MGQSVWASLALAAIVKQLAQASLVPVVEPISEVEQDLISKME
jgi:hypothetical protein